MISATSLRSVRVEPADQAGMIKVVIDAGGTLPEPVSEALTNPPRIYLDFMDVLPVRAVEPVAPNAVVSRIRVAEHSTSPLVTRIVLDLNKDTPYRIDDSSRAQGRVVVLLGGSRDSRDRPPFDSPDRPLAQGNRPGAGSQQPTLSAIPTTRAATVSAETQYGARASTAVVRLYALTPLLEAIDRRAETVPGNLDAAAKEFDDVAKLLTTIKPPSERASTHALLLRTCTLAARAVRLRLSAASDQPAGFGLEAASAAAGALMMLDKASSELEGEKGKREKVKEKEGALLSLPSTFYLLPSTFFIVYRARAVSASFPQSSGRSTRQSVR